MAAATTFTQITRSKSSARPIESRDALEATSLELLRAEMPMRRSVRLLGVSLSSLTRREDDLTVCQMALPVCSPR